MGKSFNRKNNMNYKAITFWSIISLLTIAFIIVIIVQFANRTLRPVENFDDIQLFGDMMYEKEEETYFVYIYGSDDNENDDVKELEEHILNYLTFVKRNSKNEEATKLYVFNVDAQTNARYIDSSKTSTLATAKSINELNIVANDVPTLLVMKNGSVFQPVKGLNEIKDYLLTKIESIDDVN